MADKKISELTAITGADTAADDFFIVVDTSGSATKKISRAELNNAIEQDVLAQVDITSANIDGGTIDNTPIGASTPSTGAFTTLSTTGTTTLGGNLDTNGNDITFGDNDKAIFGAGNDLQIYHSGIHSYVDDAGTGDLRLRGNAGVYLGKYTGEAMVDAIADGAVTLYYDNSPKLATTSGGIDVTGTVTADGLLNNNKSEFFASESALVSTGSTAKVYATNSTFDGVNGSLVLQSRPTAGADVYIATGATPKTVAKFNDGGDVSLYDSSGVSQGFYWDASTQRLGLGTTAPTNPLHILSSAGEAILISNSNASGNSQIKLDGATDFQIGTGQTSSGFANKFFLYDATNAATRMVVDNSGNVGIGNASPATLGHTSADNLVVGTTSGDNGITVVSGTANTGRIAFADSGDTLIGRITYNHSDNSMGFGTAGTGEHMRVDSSGQLMLNCTADQVTSYEKMSVAGAGGFKTGDTSVLALWQTKSTGNFMQLFSGASGISVATIGVDSNDNLRISGNATNHAGLYFNDQNGGAILPMRTNALTDGTVQLGSDSYRFEDLYLSGGVYLGGTGASNLLDDYEEGTWTPTLNGATTTTYTTQTGQYTKIGRLVHIRCKLVINSIGDGSTTEVAGLPFTVTSTGAIAGSAVSYSANLASSTVDTVCAPNSGATTITFGGKTAAATGISWPLATFGNSARVEFQFTYVVD